MENQFYTTSQIAKVLDMPLRKIITYTERGYIEASVLGPSGYGSRRLWSPADLKKIDILKKCEDFGLSPKFLRKLSSLLNKEELNPWSNLIIDSRGRAFNGQDAAADAFPDVRRSPYLYICQDPETEQVQPDVNML